MKKLILITRKSLFWLPLILIVGLGGYFFESGNNPFTNSVKVPFPYVSDVTSTSAPWKNSFACDSLLSSSILGSPAEYSINGIEASVSKGTDKVALVITDEKTLVLQTALNVSFGNIEGDSMQIIQNSDTKLMAVWYSDNAVSTIVLNRVTGLAVWVKGVGSSIMSDTPYATSNYMACR
jgi:hypothetical protein